MAMVWMILAQFVWMPLAKGDIVNVAFHKTVNISSIHDPNSNRFPAANGVDGNTTSIIHTHTDRPSAWWTVDLGTQVQDALVTIYFRLSNEYRRNGVQIYTAMTPFSSYPGGQLCLNITSRTDGTDIPNSVNVNCSGTWHYLMVYSRTNNGGTEDKGPILDFGEVTVLGCNRTYGQNCNKPCSLRNCIMPSTSCDRYTGACPGGCKTGWNGTDCLNECSSKEYGRNCTNSCSSRHCVVPSTTCNRFNGSCSTEGCQAGWKGIDCTIECSGNEYGRNCANVCSSRNCGGTSSPCNRFNGSCSNEGCQTGWKGIDCTIPCSNETYGKNCVKFCSYRQCAVTSTSCNHSTGACPQERCLSGWKGTDCTQICSGEMYGANCVNNCSSRHCVLPSSTCNRYTGSCPGGCEVGWMGIDCMEECTAGKYGINCSSSCNARHCAVNTSKCNRTTGECPPVGGCTSGWIGIDCSQACVGDTYGQDCNMSCGDRKCKSSSTSCDHVTGQCDGGCRPGWNGTDCIHECSSKTYGEDCSKNCVSRHCMTSSDTCDHETGACEPRGCEPGWYGTDCAQLCPLGTFGTNCFNCSIRHCKSMTECPDDGVCVGGCEDGWALSNCTQACPSGTYGPDCSSACGNCADDTVCLHATGICAGGCQAGWIGDQCKQTGQGPTDDYVVPAVAGAVAGVLVIVIIAIVIIIYRRRNRTPSHAKYDETGKKSFDAVATKRNSSDVNNVYVNVEQVQPKIERVKSGSSQPKVPADPEQEEEIPDEGEASPSTDYYNESEEVIREVVVADLAATIQKIKQREGGFATEYSRLSTGFTASYDDSQKPENAGKNKFRGLYPYDHNRVRLSMLPDIPGSDYINASLMHSYDQKKAYIAAQAPNKKTVGDFWRMIWEQRCSRVIMLTGLVEEAKVKCYQYWPEEDVLETDHHRVEVEVTDIRADYTIRRLKVTSKTNGDNRTVVQYHYTSWPDHGVPDTLALVNFIWMIRRTGTPRDGPLLVHCSAGIGRTGTYIAVDSLLDQARNEGKVDVLGYVSTMRGQRKNMIQTKEQYECVFQCLLEMTTFGNTSMDVENFITSYSSRGMDSMVDRKTLRELTQMMRTRDRKDSPGRHRMWVDGNQKFIVRVGPTLKHLKGYLQTVAPPAGLEKLFWKLVEENDVHNVIIVFPIQVDLFGDTGSTKKYGEITVTTIGQTNLTSDLALVTLQLKATNAEKSLNVKLFKCAGSNTVEGMSRHLLDHAHFHHLSDEMSPVVLIHSEPNRKGVVYLCIMGNILAGILKDHCVDVIGHVRTFLKCCPDVTLTEGDVEKLLEFSQKCIEMTESTNTYANL